VDLSRKLDSLRRFIVPLILNTLDLFAAVPPRVLQDLRQRAAVEALYELRRHPEPLLITLLAGYCYVRGQDRVECAHEAIKAWCQMWYWDSSAVLKLKQADRVWHVLPARVSKWAAKRDGWVSPPRSDNMATYPKSEVAADLLHQSRVGHTRKSPVFRPRLISIQSDNCFYFRGFFTASL
jgi:hypothetical protein